MPPSTVSKGNSHSYSSKKANGDGPSVRVEVSGYPLKFAEKFGHTGPFRSSRTVFLRYVYMPWIHDLAGNLSLPHQSGDLVAHL